MIEEQITKKPSHDGKVIIFQSMNNEQIMLPELGFVNALLAYFELHKINYLIDQRCNAEFMSPDGQLPLIKYGYKLVSGYQEIIKFINKEKNIESSNVGDSDKETHMLLFEKVVIQAELYYTWMDENIYEQYTKLNYSYGKPWPLNNILCWLKQREIAPRIENVKNKKNDLELLFQEISTRINNDDNDPELLCLIYGHIKAILSLGKPYEALYNIVKKYPALIDFVQKFENKLH